MPPSFLSEQMIDAWIEDHDDDIKQRKHYLGKQFTIINVVGSAFSIIMSYYLATNGGITDFASFMEGLPFFQSMFVIIFFVLYWEKMVKVRELLREEQVGWIFVAEKCHCTLPHIHMIDEENVETYKALVGRDLGRGCTRCGKNYKLVRIWKKKGKRYQAPRQA